MRPRIKASCFDSGPGNHGSETIEVTGNVVMVPALGDENGDGVLDPPPPREGTARADTLTGTSAADHLLGRGGNDVLRGRGGDDCLVGGAGRDRLLGGPGADRLTGGSGRDTLTGGPGVNRYAAGPGRDVVNARNGRAEVVSCGSGRDRARVDRRDKVRSCERISRG